MVTIANRFYFEKKDGRQDARIQMFHVAYCLSALNCCNKNI